MARVLITGGNGFLGQKCHEVLSLEHEVVSTFLGRPVLGETAVRLDVVDVAAVDALFASQRLDWCIHTAGNCDVDDCERRPDEATRLNVDGAAAIAAACGTHGVRLIYISTDHVFDGTAGPYFETSAPRPLQVYGKTKLAGERLAMACESAVVLRLPILYGLNLRPHKSTFLTKTLALLTQGQTLTADDRQIRYPVWIDDVANLLGNILKAPLAGVLHYSSQEGVTKFTWARKIATAFGHDPSLVESKPDHNLACRPHDNELHSDCLDAHGLRHPLNVSQGLATLATRALARPFCGPFSRGVMRQ